MKDELFFNTGFSPTGILDKLYQEASVEENYYWSPAVPPVMRCDVSGDIRSYFKSLINVPFNDCGFLKTYPNTIYPMHKDSFRISAINLPMFEETIGFESNVLNIHVKPPNLEPIPYRTHEFMLLNVMRPHMVANKTLNKNRIMLSMGFKNNSYEEMRELFKSGKLLNVL